MYDEFADVVVGAEGDGAGGDGSVAVVAAVYR